MGRGVHPRNVQGRNIGALVRHSLRTRLKRAPAKRRRVCRSASPAKRCESVSCSARKSGMKAARVRECGVPLQLTKTSEARFAIHCIVEHLFSGVGRTRSSGSRRGV